jgi:hypothetical protein
VQINTSGQKIGAQMVSATDGSAFTDDVTCYVTIDAGTQAAGSVGSGTCTHEGNGYHTYAPSSGETNGKLLAFTFVGTGAVPATVQVFTRGFDASAAVVPANVTQFGGSAGTFSGGRPEVNTTHIGGTSQTAKDLGALNVTNVNTLAGHDPGETIMGATDLGTGAGFTSLASASALSTLQGNVTTLLGRLVALAVAAGAVASGTASATAFPTDLTETADGHWNDAFLVFTTGDLAGQVKRIADYDGTSKTITVSGGFTAAPSEGDAFAIVNR